MEFFSSPTGVAIAWLSTVISGIATVISLLRERKTRKELIEVKEINLSLVRKIESNAVSLLENGSGDVSQVGKGNVYTKQNVGGMTINM